MFLYLSGGCHNKEIGRLHFLWKDDLHPIYIMDEHQGALAGWLSETKEEDEYTLYHIDQHWDATDFSEQDLETLTYSNPGLDAIVSLRTRLDQPLVDWTNYISALVCLRPKLTKAFFAADQDPYKSKLLDDPRVMTFRPEELISNLSNLLSSSGQGHLLVNVDFDFLFRHGKTRYSTNLLVNLLNKVKPYLGSQLILTAAWTPAFCGGCEVAAELCRLFCKTLGIRCPTEELDIVDK